MPYKIFSHGARRYHDRGWQQWLCVSCSSLDSPLHHNSFLRFSQAWPAVTPIYCIFFLSINAAMNTEDILNLAIWGISLCCRHIAVWWALTWISLTGNLTPHTQTMYIHSIFGCQPFSPSVGLTLCPFKSQSDRGVGAKKCELRRGVCITLLAEHLQ